VGEAFKKCSFPEGVFTILQGDQETVQKICEHKNIKAIAFVGSTPAAKMVYTQASAQGKRVLALGGAKNHIILMPDADQQMAVQGILASFTGCAGQRCMAGSVLLAVGETTEVIKILCAQARQFLPGKHMGALISQDSVARLTLAIERAKQEGVHLRVDGRRPTLPTKYLKGNWLNPTILDEVSPESFAVKEELFGPLLSIVRCKNLEEALRIENASAYGNAVSVFTSQGYHAERVVQEAQAAMVGINVGVPVPREPFSFGGTKDSKWGHGDLTGHDGVEFWTQKKKITTKWATQEKQTWIS
jgi:malonate-semialdehyde dehydrogenase (acetylating)/methylmalonate-semialdehyde dehydrogenase